jgi:Uma2 family endonuclease
MAMPAPATEWTAEMAIALPADGNRYEVLDGELFVTPAPNFGHQHVISRLLIRLDPFVQAHGLGWLLTYPADITFSPKRLVQPDLFVVPARPDGRPRSWRDVKALSLAVEVLSPSTARADRHRKRLIYQDEQVPEYWIVDVDARLFERWRPSDSRPEIITDTLVWQPLPHADALRIDVPEFFADVMR